MEKLNFWVLDIASGEQNEGLCVKTAFRLQNSVVLIGNNIKKLTYIERRALFTVKSPNWWEANHLTIYSTWLRS